MTIHTNSAAVETVAIPSAVTERAALTAAVAICCEAVERRNSIPILANVRLMATGDGAAFVSATDCDLEFTVRVPGAVDDGFATTIPALLSRDLLKKSVRSDHVAITDGGEGFAALDFERVTYNLQSLPVGDYPELIGPGHNSAFRFTMTGADFVRGLEKTMGAVSTEETRYYLNGIFMHVTRDHETGADLFRMVATDGHRMHVQTFNMPEGAAGMPGIIIPRKTVAKLFKIMKGKACPESVSLEVSDTKIRVIFERDGLPVTVTSKVVDGTFPDYRRVIPSSNSNVATVNAETMLSMSASVALVSSERGRAVKLDFGGGKCVLNVNNPDSGNATAEFECATVGDPVEIGFNHGYLADMIATAGADTVEIAMSDHGSPAIFRTGEDDGWMGVLMPMRV